MIGLGGGRRRSELKIVENSPLRGLDPRTKLALCLAASLAVMLPLQRLAVFMTVYVLLLLWARLLPSAAEQVWRIKWILVLLFALETRLPNVGPLPQISQTRAIGLSLQKGRRSH